MSGRPCTLSLAHTGTLLTVPQAPPWVDLRKRKARGERSHEPSTKLSVRWRPIRSDSTQGISSCSHPVMVNRRSGWVVRNRSATWRAKACPLTGSFRARKAGGFFSMLLGTSRGCGSGLPMTVKRPRWPSRKRSPGLGEDHAFHAANSMLSSRPQNGVDHRPQATPQIVPSEGERPRRHRAVWPRRSDTPFDATTSRKRRERAPRLGVAMHRCIAG